MSQKPGVLCKLEKGKLIDANRGFVDTFNWIVDWVSNFKCAKETGLKLDTSASDRPEVKNDTVSGSDGVEIVIPPISYDPTTHELTYKVVKARIVKVEGSEKMRTAFTAVPAYESE